MSYRGYFRELKESKIFHMRHKGILIIKDDKLAFLYTKGHIKEIEFKDIDNIEMYRKKYGILLNLKDKSVYMFTSLPSAGSYALGGTIGTHISTIRQNKEIFNILKYQINP